VAASTTSLPEQLGGVRNWDYRYSWLRDAAMNLYALFTLGYTDEAHAFMGWLERTTSGRAEDLQLMYGVGGERLLPEIQLDTLDGYRGSRPVRIGNAAADQFQLDVYGYLLDTAWLYHRHGGPITPPSGGCWPAPSTWLPAAGPSPTTASGRSAAADATSSPPRS
jgi:GH15 family glucan-1,4-alpha-glucosidase